jgi:hypothetical protein
MTSPSQGHQTSCTNLWNYYPVIYRDYATVASDLYRIEETKKERICAEASLLSSEWMTSRVIFFSKPVSYGLCARYKNWVFKLKKIEMVISVWRRDVVWRHFIMKPSRRHHYYNPYQLIEGELPSSAYYPVLRPSYYWVHPQLGSYYQQQMPYLMPGNVRAAMI